MWPGQEGPIEQGRVWDVEKAMFEIGLSKYIFGSIRLGIGRPDGSRGGRARAGELPGWRASNAIYSLRAWEAASKPDV